MKIVLSIIRRFCVLVVILISGGMLFSQIIPQYYNNTGGSSSNSFPLNSATTNKVQWIYGPGIFKTSGTTGTPAPAGLITKIYFTIGTITSSTAVYSNFTVKLAQTVGTMTNWTNTTFLTGLDTGFYAPTYSLVNPVTDGWQMVTLQNPFFYDPTLSIVMEICVSAGTGNSVRQQSTPASARIYGGYSATTGSLQSYLVNLGFDMIPGGTDVGLESFVNLPDTICEGVLPVEVALKNYGPNTLSTVKIDWKVNNVAQTTYNWNGNLAPNATTNVTIGTYPFSYGTAYSIKAYTFDPNGATDTINGNDTIIKPEIIIKPSPGLTLQDTLKTICQGDSVTMTGTLSGSPPWDLVINDGTTNIPVNNISQSSFSYTFVPASTNTYTITDIIDATGCTDNSIYNFMVTVQQAPSATISPAGSTATCEGDSVTLMGSIGMGFTYQWYLNGNPLPSDTNYVLYAKQGGDYTVKITSPIGCSNVSAPLQIIIHPLPVVDLGNDTVLFPNQSIMLDAGAGFSSYLWSTGAISQTIIVDSSGTGIGVKDVWVRVTDNYSCPGTDTIKINFTQHPGIKEAGSEVSMLIIPNPSDGLFRLKLKGYPAGSYLIEVLSRDGRTVFRSSFKNIEVSEEIKLDMKHLPAGAYIIKVVGGDRSGSALIIKNR